MLFPKPVHKPKAKKRLKKISAKSLSIKLDDMVRKIFREKWQPICYICGKHGEWGKEGIQVGHYISRKVFNLRWDFHNLYPQCSTCNSRHNHYTEPFRRAILEKEGQERLDYIDRKYQEHLKVTSLVKWAEKVELLERLQITFDRL